MLFTIILLVIVAVIAFFAGVFASQKIMCQHDLTYEERVDPYNIVVYDRLTGQLPQAKA